MAPFAGAGNAACAKPQQSACNTYIPTVITPNHGFPFCRPELGVQLSAPIIDKLVLSGIVATGDEPDHLVVQITALLDAIYKAKKPIFKVRARRFRAFRPIRKLRSFALILGKATVRFELRIDYKDGDKRLRIRIEFNPRKLKKAGVAELCAFLASLNKVGFDHSVWLKRAFVSRVDIAIDVLGVVPADLIVRVPRADRRKLYIGEHDMETEYLWMETRFKGRRRRLDLARIYDRSLKMRLDGESYPYGAVPLARVEFMPNMSGRKMNLAKLRETKCLIEGVRITHVDESAAASEPEWKIWVDIARARGPKRASERLDLEKNRAWLFEKKWRSPSPSLVSTDALWAHWEVAFDNGGLSLLFA